MLTQFIWGARISLLVGLAATLLAIVIGSLVGITAGYFGGRTGGALMRLTEWFLVIPFLPLAVALAAVLGPSITNIILVIGITSWPSTARLIRAQVLTLKERLYVDRSRALGASDAHVMGRHILPNVSSLILANLTLTVPIAILSETTLSFLGLGDPTRASWGKMLQEGFEAGALTLQAWWYYVPPGLGIMLVVLAFTLVGQALEEVLDPRLRDQRGMSLLEVRDLHVSYAVAVGARCRRCAASTSRSTRGETLGLAGESGCGKSTRWPGAMLRLLPKGTTVTGEVLLDGEDVLDDEAGAAARGALDEHGDRLPGRAAHAQPGAADRAARSARRSRSTPAGASRRGGSASCSSWSASPRGGRAPTRTSSPAASASAC